MVASTWKTNREVSAGHSPMKMAVNKNKLRGKAAKQARNREKKQITFKHEQ